MLMKHLPFNHNYRPFRWSYFNEFNSNSGWDFTTHIVTNITLLCGCGHIKTRKIANFEMTGAEFDTYVSNVYGKDS